MSTRSTIGIINRNGSVDSVYCHFDGYPEHVGKILLEHYSNEDKVRGLLNWGNMSQLGSKITPTLNSGHSYATPEEGVTVFYGRDRGEEGQGAIRQKNVTALQKVFKESWCDYLYLWDCKTNTWLYGNATYPEKMYILKRKRCKLPPLPKVKKIVPVMVSDTHYHNNVVMDDEDAYNVKQEERAGYVAVLAQRIAALRQYVDAEVNDISRILLKLS